MDRDLCPNCGMELKDAKEPTSFAVSLNKELLICKALHPQDNGGSGIAELYCLVAEGGHPDWTVEGQIVEVDVAAIIPPAEEGEAITPAQVKSLERLDIQIGRLP